MKRLIALLLCAAVLLPVAAMSDQCYYGVLNVLENEEILGQPSFTTQLENGTQACILLFDFSSNSITLVGETNWKKPFMVAWAELSRIEMYKLLKYFTGNYTTFDDLSKNQFMIGVQTRVDGDVLVLSNAEEVQHYYELLNKE